MARTEVCRQVRPKGFARMATTYSLEEFDEALAGRGGHAAVPAAGSADRTEWQALTDCLRLLADVWPRRPLDTPVGTVGTPTAAEIEIPSPPASPVLSVGRFELVGLIGWGGFGPVFLARDPLRANRRQIGIVVVALL